MSRPLICKHLTTHNQHEIYTHNETLGWGSVANVLVFWWKFSFAGADCLVVSGRWGCRSP